MNRSSRNMKSENKKREHTKQDIPKVTVPDIKDFNTIDELSNDVMEDVDTISEIMSKYDRRTTDHLMALVYHWYKARWVREVV